MADVWFVDTSVLLNLLDVPGLNDDRDEVVEVYLVRCSQGAVFVVPVVALIETGNHIAQLPGGRERHACVKRFAALLRSALAGKLPMAVSGVPWDPEFLSALVDGAGHRLSLETYAQSGMGSGDASILHEMDRYRRRIPSATPVSVWTLDTQLAAHA